MTSLASPVRLCVYMCSRTTGRLGPRGVCPAAQCRPPDSSRGLGPRGFSSRGGDGGDCSSRGLGPRGFSSRSGDGSARGLGPRGFSSRSGDGSVEDQLTLQDVARSIRERRYKRVVVMAGAGISTPSGIPDFRSPGSGLYDNLQQYDLPYAEAIFEIGFFHRNPSPFFALAKELYPGNYRPNAAHHFVRLLHLKQQLLRMYTQNIDGLERLAGIPAEMLVEAHGSFATATCTSCLRKYEGAELRADVMRGTVPRCPTCRGVIKPDVVFFGEELPRRFFRYLTDFPVADLLVVMGTSLEVEPFSSLAGAVRPSVPRLLINRDPVGPFAGRRRPGDVVTLGDVVGGVRTLVDALGWNQELEELMAADAETAAAQTE